MIEFKDVTKRYPNGTIGLQDISFKVQKGEFVFVVGPSGSGKSTIVKLILKEVSPTKGEIYVNGYAVNGISHPEIPFLRRSLGIVFQDFRLLQNKTVYENVEFAMQIVETPPKEIRRQVPLALALVGLSKKAKAYPDQLSGGEQQRAALARALVNSPSLLVADEPTGNLDPNTSWDIMKLLEEINQRGTTVMVATHEKWIVNSLKKRVIRLENGRIIGDVKEGFYEDETQDS